MVKQRYLHELEGAHCTHHANLPPVNNIFLFWWKKYHAINKEQDLLTNRVSEQATLSIFYLFIEKYS